MKLPPKYNLSLIVECACIVCYLAVKRRIRPPLALGDAVESEAVEPQVTKEEPRCLTSRS